MLRSKSVVVFGAATLVGEVSLWQIAVDLIKALSNSIIYYKPQIPRGMEDKHQRYKEYKEHGPFRR